jgi:magnesium-transporting ATPase (P-type)
MRRRPRRGDEHFFSNRFFRKSFINGFLLLCTVLVVYWVSLRMGFNEQAARGGVFATLVVGNLLLISSLLSFSQRFFLAILKNKTAVLFLSVAFLLLVGIFSLSFLQDLFSVSLPGRSIILLAVSLCSLFVFVLELIKWKQNKKSRAES